MNRNKINESSTFMISSKRKRGESNAEYISTKAPLRHKVLEFINKSKMVTEEEMKQFLNTVSEDLGFKPSSNWLKMNKQYVEFKMNENGEKVYKLSSRGKNVLKAHVKFENLRNDIRNDVVEELKGKRPRINDKINFDDMLSGKGVNKLSEAKIATNFVYANVSMRNKVLSFIDKKGKVSLTEMKEFFKTLNEEIGKTPSSSYLFQNKHLIDRTVDSNGVSTYSLTNQGRQILKHSTPND